MKTCHRCGSELRSGESHACEAHISERPVPDHFIEERLGDVDYPGAFIASAVENGLIEGDAVWCDGDTVVCGNAYERDRVSLFFAGWMAATDAIKSDLSSRGDEAAWRAEDARERAKEARAMNETMRKQRQP